jgi:hypothetical protein
MIKFLPLLLLSALFFVSGCNRSDSPADNSQSRGKPTSQQSQQLNITILCDLSDRIDIKKYPDKPEHFERDLAVVNELSNYFAKDMESKGAYFAKGKIKVVFSPEPQDPNINIWAEKLNIDLSKMDPKQKKEVHDNISSTFADNLGKIYDSALTTNKWLGSDIWRFFKNDVKDYCIDSNPEYRNILVILTDGYIYHQDSKDRNGNRFAYILPELFDRFRLRNNPNWKEEIDKQNFGLISTRSDLENLEVLVLEVTPSPNNRNDEDIIKNVLSKWFEEMKVKRFAIFNSDLPEYTKQRINDFIK